MLDQRGNTLLVIIVVIVAILIILGWLIMTNSIKYTPDNHTDAVSPSPSMSILDDFASLADLKAEQASKLYMPNTFTLDEKKIDGTQLAQLESSGTEKRQGIEGIEPATCCNWFLGTQATQQEVVNFYDTELKKLGWVSTKHNVFRTTTETKVYGWCKSNKLFRLGFFDKNTYSFDPKISKDWNYITYFQPSISGGSSEDHCP